MEIKELETLLEEHTPKEPLEEFCSQRSYDLAPRFIAKFIKQSANPRKFKPEIYSLRTNYGIGHQGLNIFHDAPYSFTLRAKGGLGNKSIATISFEPSNKDAVLVKQIQGKRGEAKYLAPIKWERMLLNLVTNWAKQNGYKTIKVQPASKNRSDTVRRRGKMVYDITAKRCGFKMDEQGYYSKDLT